LSRNFGREEGQFIKESKIEKGPPDGRTAAPEREGKNDLPIRSKFSNTHDKMGPLPTFFRQEIENDLKEKTMGPFQGKSSCYFPVDEKLGLK
jgi:hypothetical protein